MKKKLFLTISLVLGLLSGGLCASQDEKQSNESSESSVLFLEESKTFFSNDFVMLKKRLDDCRSVYQLLKKQGKEKECKDLFNSATLRIKNLLMVVSRIEKMLSFKGDIAKALAGFERKRKSKKLSAEDVESFKVVDSWMLKGCSSLQGNDLDNLRHIYRKRIVNFLFKLVYDSKENYYDMVDGFNFLVDSYSHIFCYSRSFGSDSYCLYKKHNYKVLFTFAYSLLHESKKVEWYYVDLFKWFVNNYKALDLGEKELEEFIFYLLNKTESKDLKKYIECYLMFPFFKKCLWNLVDDAYSLLYETVQNEIGKFNQLVEKHQDYKLDNDGLDYFVQYLLNKTKSDALKKECIIFIQNRELRKINEEAEGEFSSDEEEYEED